MKYRKTMAIMACLFGMVLFTVVKIKVNYGVKPNVATIPHVSAMILYKGSTDEEIMMAVKANRQMLHETYYSSVVVGQRTPLLSALEKDRTDIVVYLLKSGIPVRDTVEILHKEGLLHHISRLHQILDEEGLGNAMDCDADCFAMNK